MFKGEVAASVLGFCIAVHLCFGYPEDVVGLPGISMVRGSSDRVSQLLKCRCYVPLWWYSGYHVLTLCFQSKFISSANYGIKRKFPKIYLIYSSFLSHSFPLSLFEFHTHVILFSWFKHTISHLISFLSLYLSLSFFLSLFVTGASSGGIFLHRDVSLILPRGDASDRQKNGHVPFLLFRNFSRRITERSRKHICRHGEFLYIFI